MVQQAETHNPYGSTEASRDLDREITTESVKALSDAALQALEKVVSEQDPRYNAEAIAALETCKKYLGRFDPNSHAGDARAYSELTQQGDDESKKCGEEIWNAYKRDVTQVVTLLLETAATTTPPATIESKKALLKIVGGLGIDVNTDAPTIGYPNKDVFVAELVDSQRIAELENQAQPMDQETTQELRTLKEAQSRAERLHAAATALGELNLLPFADFAKEFKDVPQDEFAEAMRHHAKTSLKVCGELLNVLDECLEELPVGVHLWDALPQRVPGDKWPQGNPEERERAWQNLIDATEQRTGEKQRVYDTTARNVPEIVYKGFLGMEVPTKAKPRTVIYQTDEFVAVKNNRGENVYKQVKVAHMQNYIAVPAIDLWPMDKRPKEGETVPESALRTVYKPAGPMFRLNSAEAAAQFLEQHKYPPIKNVDNDGNAIVKVPMLDEKEDPTWKVMLEADYNRQRQIAQKALEDFARLGFSPNPEEPHRQQTEQLPHGAGYWIESVRQAHAMDKQFDLAIAGLKEQPDEASTRWAIILEESRKANEELYENTAGMYQRYSQYEIEARRRLEAELVRRGIQQGSTAWKAAIQGDAFMEYLAEVILECDQQVIASREIASEITDVAMRMEKCQNPEELNQLKFILLELLRHTDERIDIRVKKAMGLVPDDQPELQEELWTEMERRFGRRFPERGPQWWLQHTEELTEDELQRLKRLIDIKQKQGTPTINQPDMEQPDMVPNQMEVTDTPWWESMNNLTPEEIDKLKKLMEKKGQTQKAPDDTSQS